MFDQVLNSSKDGDGKIFLDNLSCLSSRLKIFPFIQFEPFTFQMPIVSCPLAMHNCEDNLYGELLAFSKATSSPCWISLRSAFSSHGVSQSPDYSCGLLAELHCFIIPPVWEASTLDMVFQMQSTECWIKGLLTSLRFASCALRKLLPFFCCWGSLLAHAHLTV